MALATSVDEAEVSNEIAQLPSALRTEASKEDRYSRTQFREGQRPLLRGALLHV